jgi:hypothetical protein
VRFNQSTEVGINVACANTPSGAFSFMRFENDLYAQLGAISYNSATTTFSYGTTSDRRLKNVVGPLASADVIDRLNPVAFTWKQNGAPGAGFLAQELFEVFPNAVVPGDEGQTIKTPWMVDVSALVPVVVAELKALRKRVSSLEARADQSPTTLPGERTII